MVVVVVAVAVVPLNFVTVYRDNFIQMSSCHMVRKKTI